MHSGEGAGQRPSPTRRHDVPSAAAEERGDTQRVASPSRVTAERQIVPKGVGRFGRGGMTNRRAVCAGGANRYLVLWRGHASLEDQWLRNKELTHCPERTTRQSPAVEVPSVSETSGPPQWSPYHLFKSPGPAAPPLGPHILRPHRVPACKLQQGSGRGYPYWDPGALLVADGELDH